LLNPQSNLRLLQADAIADVRRFGRCHRIIALRDEVSPVRDELSGGSLPPRYVLPHDGIREIKDQLNRMIGSVRMRQSCQRKMLSHIKRSLS
jgi:chromosome condensin MukBEF complex kleisin-like MukF subunit